jgi:hypothetical protein
MGKAISPFSAPWTNYPGNNFDGLVGGGGTVTGVNQFTYTAQFGNGISGTIAAQDQVQYYQAGVVNLGALTPLGTGVSANGSLGPFGASDYAGTMYPDFIGVLKVDQAWGVFQASAVAHDNHAAYYGHPTVTIPGTGSTELNGHPNDKWGWAAQLALSLKADWIAPGDVFNVQGVYTKGATRYNIQDLASQAGANTIYGSSGLPGAFQSVGFGIAPDTVFASGTVLGTGTEQQLVQTWGMRGGYTHNWNPYWNSSIYGAWAAVHYNDNAKLLICGPGGLTGGSARGALNPAPTAVIPATAITSCNPDYNIGQIGAVLRWNPVKNLTFSADATYSHLDQKSVGTVVASSNTIGKPVAVYELKDQNTWLFLLRAQRNW